MDHSLAVATSSRFAAGPAIVRSTSAVRKRKKWCLVVVVAAVVVGGGGDGGGGVGVVVVVVVGVECFNSLGIVIDEHVDHDPDHFLL